MSATCPACGQTIITTPAEDESGQVSWKCLVCNSQNSERTSQDVDTPESKRLPILAIQKWTSNGSLIADCARLGYLRKDWRTLDASFGRGIFWKEWAPDTLIACDLDAEKSPIGYSVDFTDLPFPDRSFDAVVIDGPYRLNGRPDRDFDEGFGIDVRTRWQDRMDLILDGVMECSRVLGDGYLLVKVQDQVVSGKKRWMVDEVTEVAKFCGLGKVDRLDFLSYRAQPEGRSQKHAHCCSSQLLVFQRGHDSSVHYLERLASNQLLTDVDTYLDEDIAYLDEDIAAAL